MTQIFLSYAHDDLLPPNLLSSRASPFATALPSPHPDRLAALHCEAITRS